MGIPDGFGIEECIEVCKLVEVNGVTAIDITSGTQETPDWTSPPSYMPAGLNTDITAAMKKAGIKIPISVAGKIDDPALAEEILADGKADFISIARGFNL